jgi:hypothetical protein
VGAPSSGIFSKIFLCCIETSQIAYLTKSTWSSTASVQVNNILLIFDFAHTNIQSILTDFNSIHPNLHFTAETEHNIQAPVYRKLTFTDTVIPYTSKHPFQHKYAAIRYLHNILHTYQLHNEEYNHEINFTHNILYNTSFPIQPLRPPKIKHEQAVHSEIPKYKWATLTYKGKETTYITTIFKHTNLKIAYCTNNSIQENLIPNFIFPKHFLLVESINMSRLWQRHP